jgi:hypothetical protein
VFWPWIAILVLLVLAFAFHICLRRVLKKMGRAKYEQNIQALDAARKTSSEYCRAILEGNYLRAYQVAGYFSWDPGGFEEFVAKQTALTAKFGPLRSVVQVRERSGLDKEGWWLEIHERSHYQNGSSEEVLFLREDDDDIWKIVWRRLI